MGKNQEVYDAEFHAICRAMLALFQEPRGQKVTIFVDVRTASQRITSDAPGPGQRYALSTAQQEYDLWEQRRAYVQLRWVPGHVAEDQEAAQISSPLSKKSAAQLCWPSCEARVSTVPCCSMQTHCSSISLISCSV